MLPHSSQRTFVLKCIPSHTAIRYLGLCTSVFKGVCRRFGANARLLFIFLKIAKTLSHSPFAFKNRGRPKGLAKDKVESEIIVVLSVRPH